MLLFMAHPLEWTGSQMRNRNSGGLGTNDNPDSLILSWAQAFSLGFVELCRMGLKPFIEEVTVPSAAKGSPWHLGI